MPDIPQPAFTKLENLARDLISAHAAVREGIATHAETEAAQRDAARRKLEATRKLNANMPVKSG
jgi:hypothetical protein